MLRLFRRLLLLAAALVSCSLSAPGQPGGYSDGLVVQHHIWALTAGGSIRVYDSTGTKVRWPSLDGITAKLIAGMGNDVVIQQDTRLRRWSSRDSTWRTVGRLSTPAFALVMNSRGESFAITQRGVLQVATGKTRLPAASPNSQLRALTGFEKPAACFLDQRDVLWIGFGYGEWGGNIFAYDTRRNQFIQLNFNKFQIDLQPVKSFFQLPGSVGVSAGLQHFINSGAIIDFRPAGAQLIYDTWATRDSARAGRFGESGQLPYIGPAVFLPKPGFIYFYSSLGVFRGRYGTDLQKLAHWEKVFAPRLHWRDGQPDAVGSPMNVLKLLALGDNRLVLLTQNDGIGLWDGSSFKLLP